MVRAIVCALAALAAACAHGSEDTGDQFQTLDVGSGALTGTGGFGGSSVVTSSSGVGASSAGGASGVGGGSGGGGGCDFSHPNTCGTATQLGNVAGDQNEPAVVVTGTTSEWLLILIEEKDSSIFDADLSYTASLASPSGMNYDLFVHQGPQDGPPNCSAAAKLGMPSGGQEVVSDKWDDDQPLGGEDDSVFLSIEVRHISGTNCTAPWTLTIEGNTL